MKKLCLILMFVFLPAICLASPFVICDPQAGVTSYVLTGPAWMPTSVPAQPDGSIKLDVAQSLVGSTSMTAKACITDPSWGVACSDASPFVYTRPAPPVIIKAIRLTQ